MWLLNPLVWCGVILVAMVIALWPAEGDDEDADDDEEDERAAPAALAAPSADEAAVTETLASDA